MLVPASSTKPRQSGRRWPRARARRISRYQAIDSLLDQSKAQPVVEITEAMLRNDPRDWEALYRQRRRTGRAEKPEEAIKRFHALLALTINDDEKSSFRQGRARNPMLQGAQAARPRFATRRFLLEQRMA